MRKTIFPVIASGMFVMAPAFAADDTSKSMTNDPAPVAAPAPSAVTAGPATGDQLTLSDAQAKAWTDKVVYSSDGKNVGEVAAIARDNAGNVTELQADIGGFLGLGETRVKVLPSQFKFGQDRIVLAMTAEEAKKLPAIPK